MERYLNWNGILIEANNGLFRQILAKRRHAWTLPVCLSAQPYPTKVCMSFYLKLAQKGSLLTQTEFVVYRVVRGCHLGKLFPSP
jgi:hypothetical protein